MPYDTLPPAAAHRVELDGRERLIVSGVDDVDRFDENEIVMTTSAGTLIVTGESLHIGKLSLDGGELHVDGRIDSLLYEDTDRPSAGCSAACSEAEPWASRSAHSSTPSGAPFFSARRSPCSMTACARSACAAAPAAP